MITKKSYLRVTSAQNGTLLQTREINPENPGIKIDKTIVYQPAY